MSPRLNPTGDEFLSTACLVMTGSVDLDNSVEEVWEALTRNFSAAGGLIEATWHPERPEGVGARRTIRLLHFIRKEEEYYRWSEQQRVTFRVTELNLPGVSGWGEDLVLEARGSSASRLHLTMAIENKLLRTVGVPRWLKRRLDAACKKLASQIVAVLPPPTPAKS